ncbi:lipoprotein [Acetobacter estunensis NRIC 0472]|uniref:Endolytic peptidoglycan transglycosylase RlpA n=1 Tax=Acetobacter estunensis TaxID=104097 RepID=A0A967B2M2_9PROT|nr:RlpA-like double-psi beta-barrel domain-containing protein [Acetobacter estunensis]NHO52595.1 hypothetical protein [Acetobacter estunensis]GBQ22646.1 lipoprotein [Acetobacter estunensis NRIC 0472]
MICRAVKAGTRVAGHGWPLVLALGVSGCQPPRPTLTPHVHYEVGAAYQADGVWHYPQQDLSYRATGLAVIDPSTDAPRLTADGEVYDPQAMAGAHPTLQLPAQATVHNLDNGREITIRINDRGPAQRGRLLSLTPQVARMLAMGTAPARVEIIEDELPSRMFAETLPGGPLLNMQAAPVEQVTVNALDGKNGIAQTPASPAAVGANRVPVTALADLPVTARQGWAVPTSLWIEIGRFTQRSYAALAAMRAGGTVSASDDDRGPLWRVRVGPFTRVDEADAALDRALAAGLTGAHIVVE